MPADPQPVRVRAAQHSNGGGVGEGTRPNVSREASWLAEVNEDQCGTAERVDRAGGLTSGGVTRGTAESKRRLAVGQLLEAIADPDNLTEAWRKVRANAGAAGIDGESIALFAAGLEVHLGALRRRLLSAQRYVPPAVRRVEIPKPDGRTRHPTGPKVPGSKSRQPDDLLADQRVVTSPSELSSRRQCARLDQEPPPRSRGRPSRRPPLLRRDPARVEVECDPDRRVAWALA
jgi:hypothetical protein